MLVVDASIILAWLLTEARAGEAEAVLRRTASEVVWTPAICWLEVGNALRTGMRRGQIDAAFRDASVGRMRVLGLLSDRNIEPGGATLDIILSLSDRFGLTTYDAAYLELALRLGADLATFDDALAAAARQAGVPVVP